MKICFVLGTRPEAIKLAPIIHRFSDFEPTVCCTGQHDEMLHPVLEFFNIPVHRNFTLLNQNQSLSSLLARGLALMDEYLSSKQFDFIFVQGDTTSTLIGALSAYHHKIKLGYIESGLRSYDKYQPFPEEKNRQIISHLADYHFSPTERAVENLKKEGIQDKVWNVGNTAVDALFLGTHNIRHRPDPFPELNSDVVLVTMHRRENMGEPMDRVCDALIILRKRFPHLNFVLTLHANPAIQKQLQSKLQGRKGFFLVSPQPYPEFIRLMQKAYIILSDSGGIQEEAPSLDKPVLVTREVTERQEGLEAGTSLLVGTTVEGVVNGVTSLLNDKALYQKMASAKNPYGDGRASQKIWEIFQKEVQPGTPVERHLFKV